MILIDIISINTDIELKPCIIRVDNVICDMPSYLFPLTVGIVVKGNFDFKIVKYIPKDH